MLKGIACGFFFLSACCTERGSWKSILGFALVGGIFLLIDAYNEHRKKMFKDAVEREVNRRIYRYKRNEL